MIFLDSNLFVIDLRYRNDPVYADNRRFLDRIRARQVGITGLVNVLETCGILSFNLAPRSLVELFVHFPRRYGVSIVPGGDWDSRIPSPTSREILEQMRHRMALKDAEIALLVEEQSPAMEAFVTWNAKHFAGKLSVPVFTPRQWLARRRRKA